MIRNGTLIFFLPEKRSTISIETTSMLAYLPLGAVHFKGVAMGAGGGGEETGGI